MTLKLHLVAFEDRQTGFIFVGVPNEHGRYLRTHRCVAQSPCSLCGSTIGEPCMNRSGGYVGSTHVARQISAGRLCGRAPVEDILIIEPTQATTV